MRALRWKAWRMMRGQSSAIQRSTFLVVAFPRMLLGLLAGPLQSPPEHPTQVIGVVADAEVPLNQHSHTLAGPQVVGPAVSHGSLVEQGFQGNPLSVGQSRHGAMGKLGHQAVRLPGQSSPAMQRCRRDTQNTRDNGRRFSRIDEVNGPTPPTFQFSRTPDGSHASFYAPQRSKNVFPRAFLSKLCAWASLRSAHPTSPAYVPCTPQSAFTPGIDFAILTPLSGWVSLLALSPSEREASL